MTEIRVGHGFDIHPYSEDPDRSMILGGVIFEGPGLEGIAMQMLWLMRVSTLFLEQQA